VAPARVTTGMIYKGIIPFVILQLIGLATLFFFPELITWLPRQIYN
jgi:TRAP-type mannitol/chloroaromatic compound transport system permease large subunit